MALIKSKMTGFGIEAEYWKVTMISVDRDRKELSLSLNLYLAKGANQFLESIGITLNELEPEERIARYNQYFENDYYPNLYTACYQYAKDFVPFFVDAVSDVE